MALDANILLRQKQPQIDLQAAARAPFQALAATNEIKQMPIRNQLLQQRAQLVEQANEDAIRQAQLGEMTLAFRSMKPFIDQGDIAGASNVLGALGISEELTEDIQQELQDTPENVQTKFNSALNALTAQKGGLTAGQKEFSALTQGMAPEDVIKARRIKLGLDPKASAGDIQQIDIGGVPHLFDRVTQTVTPVNVSGRQVTPETVGESRRLIKTEEASGQVQGKTKEERRVIRIGTGVDAAKGIPTVVRGLELLEIVSTGGPQALSLAVKQRLGLEGADEGELSNKLAKSVLSQLKDVFGAQFTEAEGERLERIEAGFGKNTKVNKRLLNEILQVAKRQAKQGIKDAVAAEDFETAAAIKNSMEFRFNPDDDIFTNAPQIDITPQGGQPDRRPQTGIQEGQTATNPQTGERIVFSNGQWKPAP